MPTHPDVLGALLLRRWARARFSGRSTPPPDLPATAWGLFLSREACAARLRPLAPTPPPTALSRAADEELQRILLLRLEVEEVLSVARRLGVRPILLKGGAALHRPERAVAGRDLDLLLSGPEASALLAAMASDGWRSEGRGPVHHHADRIRPGGLPIEVHSSDAGESVMLGPDVERRAVPHPTFDGARLLHPEDQVRHLAYHQTIQHTSHRGRLRDLLLLGDALTDLGTSPATSAWGLATDEAPPIAATLASATALRAPDTATDPDEEMAAVWYQLDAHASKAPLGTAERFGTRWLFDLIAGGGSPARRWRLMRTPQLDAAYPRLLQVARLLAFPPVLILAWLRASDLRRGARTALAELDRALEHRA